GDVWPRRGARPRRRVSRSPDPTFRPRTVKSSLRRGPARRTCPGFGSVRVAATESLANCRHKLAVAALLARFDATRPRQVDLDDVGDATGSRAHDDDPRR